MCAIFTIIFYFPRLLTGTFISDRTDYSSIFSLFCTVHNPLWQDILIYKIMNKTDEKEELTLQNVPRAVNYLINEIAEMRILLEHIESQLGLGVDKHRPIGIEDAGRILDQTKNGINKLVRNCSIPHYLKGKKVYFFEDELVKWVEKDRIQTLQEKYSNRRLH